MSRPLIVHVGASKSGTSALQFALRKSQARLHELGIGTPVAERAQVLRRLLHPLGWRPATGFSEAPDLEVLPKLARAVTRTPGDVWFLSCEDLAEADAGRIALLGDVFAEIDVEVRVVVSSRNWARQLPSEYQQFLQVRLTQTFEEFLIETRERSGPTGDRFWRRQAVPEIAARWSAVTSSGAVTVVSSPSYATDPTGVHRLFGELVGFEVDDLTIRGGDINRSYGVVEAEVLRRINVAAAGLLPSYDEQYAPVVRQRLVRAHLPRQASAKLVLPTTHLDWVRDLGTRHVAELRDAGHPILGDPDALVAGPDAAGDVAPPDETALSTAAFELMLKALTDG